MAPQARSCRTFQATRCPCFLQAAARCRRNLSSHRPGDPVTFEEDMTDINSRNSSETLCRPNTSSPSKTSPRRTVRKTSSKTSGYRSIPEPRSA